MTPGNHTWIEQMITLDEMNQAVLHGKIKILTLYKIEGLTGNRGVRPVMIRCVKHITNFKYCVTSLLLKVLKFVTRYQILLSHCDSTRVKDCNSSM